MKRVSIFILLALALVACGPKKTKDPAQALAQDFAKLYLAQLDFKEEDWRQLEEDLSRAGQVIKLDGDLEAGREAARDLPAIYDPFKEVMTREALETMVNPVPKIWTSPLPQIVYNSIKEGNHGTRKTNH